MIEYFQQLKDGESGRLPYSHVSMNYSTTNEETCEILGSLSDVQILNQYMNTKLY